MQYLIGETRTHADHLVPEGLISKVWFVRSLTHLRKGDFLLAASRGSLPQYFIDVADTDGASVFGRFVGAAVVSSLVAVFVSTVVVISCGNQ